MEQDFDFGKRLRAIPAVLVNADVNSLDDQRIADYRLLADPSALKHAGLFVAEGRLVVRRLLGLPRFAVRSVLVTPPARAALDDVPATRRRDLRRRSARHERVTGFNMHRGCLALAERPQDDVVVGGMLPVGPSRPGARGRQQSRQHRRSLPQRGGVRRGPRRAGTGLRRSAVSQGHPHVDGGGAAGAVRQRRRMARRADAAAIARGCVSSR